MYEQKGLTLHQPINPNGVGFEIYESLHRHQINKPNDAALLDPKTKKYITYKELYQTSIQLAQALEGENLTEDDCIVIFSENEINYFLPVIAAAFIGVPVAAINCGYKCDELVHVLNISKPKVIFVSSFCLDSYKQIENKCSSIKTVILTDMNGYNFLGVKTIKGFIEQRHYSREWKPKAVNCKIETFAILFSSGTTGVPKGVELTHEGVQVRMVEMGDSHYAEILPNENRLALLPFFHCYGLVNALGEIYLGLPVVVINRFEEEPFLEYIQDYKINKIFVVPPVIVTLAKSTHIDKYDLSSLKYIYSGAAPLDKKIELVVRQRLKISNIVQGYGLTEITQVALKVPLPIRQDKSGSVGVVVSEVIASVMDIATGKLLGPNEPGELCFKGPCVMKGYLNNPEATAESFLNGWLLTGDVGCYDQDGYFYVIDRRKELIKYKSFQVAPAELEAMLLTNEKVRDAAVIGVPDERAGELPMAFIVTQEGAAVTAEEIVKFIEDRLSNPKRLRGGVRFVQAIPKTPSGKILRKALREMVKQEELNAKQ